VQATLEANPGLAARGILLPLGTRVSLPLFRIETAASNSRKPWDGAT
jgi:phage tail protein X